MQEILPGVFHWTTRHPRIGIEVSSHWLDAAGVAIDPLLPPEGLDWFRARPVPPAAVLLSNRHHYRQADELAREFGCPVFASRPGLHEFGVAQRVVPFDFGDELPGGVRAIEIGGICADDTALHMVAQRALLFADALVDGRLCGGEPTVRFVEDALMNDPQRDKPALLAAFERVLAEVDFEHVLMAHGLPLIGTGRAALARFVATGGRGSS